MDFDRAVKIARKLRPEVDYVEEYEEFWLFSNAEKDRLMLDELRIAVFKDEPLAMNYLRWQYESGKEPGEVLSEFFLDEE